MVTIENITNQDKVQNWSHSLSNENLFNIYQLFINDFLRVGKLLA